MKKYIASGPCIYAGDAEPTPVLEFQPKRARRVGDENHYPRQTDRGLENSRYELRIPFKDDRELLMDILKYGAALGVKRTRFLIESAKGQIGAMAVFFDR